MRISDWSSDVCSSDLLVTSPVALIRHLFGVVVLFLITGLVLGLGVPLILGKLLGLPRDSNIYQIVMMLTGLVIILVTLRALFQPLILRYGGPAGDDTHGSARFATDRETRPLPQNGEGLSSEERRVGKGWVSTCSARGSPDH